MQLSFTQALEQLRGEEKKKPDVRSVRTAAHTVYHTSHHCCLFRPNSGFVEQLKLWEAKKCRIDTRCKSYQAYMLRHQAMQMRGTNVVVVVTVIQWMYVHKCYVHVP